MDEERVVLGDGSVLRPVRIDDYDWNAMGMDPPASDARLHEMLHLHAASLMDEPPELCEPPEDVDVFERVGRAFEHEQAGNIMVAASVVAALLIVWWGRRQ